MFELAVNFPIHNEEKSIIGVLNEWIFELDKLKIDYCLVISEDGSKDKTKLVLSEFIQNNKKRVIDNMAEEKRGYTGATISGIKIANAEPLYVIKINSEKNEIIVGPKEKLGKKNIKLKNLNLLIDKEELDKDILVKVRSTGNLLKAKVVIGEQGGAEVSLHKEEDGISPGQACVFYDKDQHGHKVLGGGWIKE